MRLAISYSNGEETYTHYLTLEDGVLGLTEEEQPDCDPLTLNGKSGDVELEALSFELGEGGLYAALGKYGDSSYHVYKYADDLEGLEWYASMSEHYGLVYAVVSEDVTWQHFGQANSLEGNDLWYGVLIYWDANGDIPTGTVAVFDRYTGAPRMRELYPGDSVVLNDAKQDDAANDD